MRQGATTDDWLRASDEQLGAALKLRETHARASISRAYYGDYSMCCACFEDRGIEKAPTSRSDEWWYPHASLARNLQLILEDCATLGYNDWDERRVNELIRSVVELQLRRVEADYLPQRQRTTSDSADACHQATAVLEALRQLVEVSDDAG